MLTIPVRVCGDTWTNPEEVHSLLSKAAGKETVVLDLQAEGPSLRKLYIDRTIDSYCKQYQIPPDQIHIINWSNTGEVIPYTISNSHLRSHFFGRSHQYWIDQLPESTHRCVFGFFLGRKTIPRSVIMYYLWHTYRRQVLLSSMETRIPLPWVKEPMGYNLEKIKDWSKQIDYREFCTWWNSNPISSLDNYFVHDQYSPDYNTNQSLLSFYPTFDIEIVAESYTLGDTFFPTEKTVRPIMAAKPIIVYGPVGFLAGLRKLGFETYGSLWSEEYDKHEYVNRWVSMKQVIDGIMSMSPEDRTELIAKATEIAMRNRQHLEKLKATGPR
jgi:hypothetical protein